MFYERERLVVRKGSGLLFKSELDGDKQLGFHHVEEEEKGAFMLFHAISPTWNTLPWLNFNLGVINSYLL